MTPVILAAVTTSASVSPPVVVIEPRRKFSLRLDELWAYRELFYFLIWRDIKVRYKQTALGAAWAVIQPLLADGRLHPLLRPARAASARRRSRIRSSRSRRSSRGRSSRTRSRGAANSLVGSSHARLEDLLPAAPDPARRAVLRSCVDLRHRFVVLLDR